MKRSISSTVSTVAVLAGLSLPARATDYFVNGTVVSSGTGLSWVQAFKTINEATSLAGFGDRVFVAGDEVPPLVYVELYSSQFPGIPL